MAGLIAALALLYIRHQRHDYAEAGRAVNACTRTFAYGRRLSVPYAVNISAKLASLVQRTWYIDRAHMSAITSFGSIRAVFGPMCFETKGMCMPRCPTILCATWSWLAHDNLPGGVAPDILPSLVAEKQGENLHPSLLTRSFSMLPGFRSSADLWSGPTGPP